MNIIPKTIGVISGLNEGANFIQWVTSAISSLQSRWNGTEKEKLQGDILQLKSDLQCLSDTLPLMYKLIDRAEWKIHDHCVADLLSKLKDAVYDAEDLLDEFAWHELKVSVEGNAVELDPFIDFFNTLTQGSFNKVTDIQKRLNNLSNQLKEMGFYQAITPRFDESLRPMTTSFRTEPKIFGRKKELEEVVRLLGVSKNSSRSSEKRKRSSNAANNEPRAASIPVLPIVGIGGVGKTTLVQEITTLQRVKAHFNKIIWICVSDDFEVERFTKVLIKSLSGKEVSADNLDDLQQDLVAEVEKKRFLLILDDIWPNALKEDGQCWRKFCAPLTNVLQGSMLLVTTRFAEVADMVGTRESFTLEGLQNDVFWEFFKLCVFGSEDYHIDPQLEIIGRSILPKLKGTPLAAKTIGRLLRKNLNPAHWNDILNSELWQLRQKENDILPALRLSYMYLPFYLKRCFSFCAVYPKDYNFVKASLTEIWVAEGFVELQGSIPLQHIGDQYFEDLVTLSFFQKLRGKYVIHDLMHDMAQLVSKDECFIVKNSNDIEKVPQSVRNLSILPITNVNCSNLSSLSKCTKLRTLLCNKPLSSGILSSAMDHWFNKLLCLRVIFCVSTQILPESIGNLKHLRYFEISRTCPVKSLPLTFCSLYNLQIFKAKKCNFAELPRGISKLINLQKFESCYTQTEVKLVDAADCGEQIRTINKFYKDTRDLTIYNLGAISKDCAGEVELWKMEYLNSVTLRWSSSTCPKHKETEVLQALQAPPTIKSVHLDGFPGENLPRWFGGHGGPEDINGRVGTIFESLTELRIEGCQNISSLEQFLQPTYAPAIRKIEITDCTSIKSVAAEWSSLEELWVLGCPNITHLLAPSLKKLYLRNSGTLGVNINCSSLTIFHLSCDHLATIELLKWSLPVLHELMINGCGSLTFIRESEHLTTDRSRRSTGRFPLLTHLTIDSCSKLESLDDLLTYAPAIESISVWHCEMLLSLPTETFGSFSSLKNLVIVSCPGLSWQSGMLLPQSLQNLTLIGCGDFSAWPPSCLENLSSLESLVMSSCKGIVCIPARNLKSLQKLKIRACPDLVSIGGPEGIANINTLYVDDCPKLKEIEQPRGEFWYVCHLVAV